MDTFLLTTVAGIIMQLTTRLPVIELVINPEIRQEMQKVDGWQPFSPVLVAQHVQGAKLPYTVLAPFCNCALVCFSNTLTYHRAH